MDKKFLFDTIQAQAPMLCGLSDKIWEYSELSMMEYKSAAEYIRLLREQGFTVQETLCGLPTAFSGSFGSGKPVIGILGEFDALSGLSQQAGATRRTPREDCACGQGCGHNLLGAASLSAAIAIKDQIAAGKLHGTVVFYGCPGEEGCAGKTFMARDGLFQDLDAAITWHPGYTNEVTTGSNAACLQMVYEFAGTAAHAAGNPWEGRSALDGAELMNVGVQFLREHMEPKSSIHYSIADAGGISPNVVQPTAKLIYMVRAETVRKAKALLARVNDIAKGAALMTGTTVTWHQLDGTSDTLSNTVLEQLLYDNLVEAPLPEYTQQEWDFAAKLRETYPHDGLPGHSTETNPVLKKQIIQLSNHGNKAINDFVVPYYPAYSYSPGSTDVGDVSWLTPTAQFNTATWPSQVPGHSWQVVATGKTGMAHKGLLYAAKVLAGAAMDLMEKPELVKAARQEFRETAAAGYDCPIGPEVVPSAQ
ncbi:MAG: amidohydrolase [Candidatus Faecousia sp.]|nr:amidohydrolase [Candidatus Faecousia sp.]